MHCGSIILSLSLSLMVFMILPSDTSSTEIVVLRSISDEVLDSSNNSPSSPFRNHSDAVSSRKVSLCELLHKKNHHSKKACPCRRISCPVCGTDGVSYGNVCYLHCAKARHPDLDVAYNGRCTQQ